MILVALAALTLISPAPASAFTMLTAPQRGQILRSADMVGPNGQRITDPACIGGRLSTVDPRWAMAFLSNTNSCFRRYGGASGESTLFERSSESSTDWRIVGSVSETCNHHEAGASDAVLRDLGCASFENRPRRVRHCSNAGTPPDTFLANITTRHVSCRTARRFIVSLLRVHPDFKTEVTHFRAYTCTPSPEGVAAVWVRCVEGPRLIRWLNGT
jgi:hypothetical protein